MLPSELLAVKEQKSMLLESIFAKLYWCRKNSDMEFNQRSTNGLSINKASCCRDLIKIIYMEILCRTCLFANQMLNDRRQASLMSLIPENLRGEVQVMSTSQVWNLQKPTLSQGIGYSLAVSKNILRTGLKITTNNTSPVGWRIPLVTPSWMFQPQIRVILQLNEECPRKLIEFLFGRG